MGGSAQGRRVGKAKVNCEKQSRRERSAAMVCRHCVHCSFSRSVSTSFLAIARSVQAFGSSRSVFHELGGHGSSLGVMCLGSVVMDLPGCSVSISCFGWDLSVRTESFLADRESVLWSWCCLFVCGVRFLCFAVFVISWRGRDYRELCVALLRYERIRNHNMR